ncbi:MAG: lysozyme [Nitrospinae bacterium]|nr:lysozyme [Nitrospinota bacterium]
MKTNSEGLALIMDSEGFRADWYLCPAGKPTIGFGHTGPLPEGFNAPLSQDQAERLLRLDLAAFEKAVSELVKVQLTANRFSALVSFVYNVGVQSFRKSALLRRLNALDYALAAEEFKRWVKARGKPLPGLVKRRLAERELFLKEDTDEFFPA